RHETRHVQGTGGRGRRGPAPGGPVARAGRLSALRPPGRPPPAAGRVGGRTGSSARIAHALHAGTAPGPGRPHGPACRLCRHPGPVAGGPVLGGTRERRRGAGRERRPGRRAARASFAIAGDQRFFMISRMMTAVSLGVLPTRTPTFSRASFFASAVPDEPDTMAPAWPMVLPSGAVNPAT